MVSYHFYDDTIDDTNGFVVSNDALDKSVHQRAYLFVYTIFDNAKEHSRVKNNNEKTKRVIF